MRFGLLYSCDVAHFCVQEQIFECVRFIDVELVNAELLKSDFSNALSFKIKLYIINETAYVDER